MPFTVAVALSVLPLLATVCFYILRSIRPPRRKRKHKSRFGFHPVAAGNALQAVQAILQPSARHLVQLRQDDRAEEDDSSDPNDPVQHLHRQAARIRRGEAIDQITAILPSPPSTPAPPS